LQNILLLLATLNTEKDSVVFRVHD
jgi:hypothetical protein